MSIVVRFLRMYEHLSLRGREEAPDVSGLFQVIRSTCQRYCEKMT